MKRLASRALLLCSVLVGAPGAAVAEVISLQLEGGVTALADYRRGESDQAAVLMLHGFSQTYNFHTISRLAESLADEGYTVLSPTLSLGVPNRQQSLACEAIHTHTLQSDQSELAAWMDWLQAAGHSDIVMIGHSTGSMTLLSYLDATADPRVDALIGISIIEGRTDLDAAAQAALRAELAERVAAGNRELVEHQLSFCAKLRATPASLLSYLEWTPERVLEAIAAVATPQIYIIGSADTRFGANWADRLAQTTAAIEVIDGANHFMDGEYEFSLTDSVLEHLP